MFDDVSITYEPVEDEVEPAPEDAVLVVEPSWRNVLAASTVDRPFHVASSFDSGVETFLDEKDPEWIYTLGSIETGNTSTTPIDLSQIQSVFHPNATQAYTGRNRTELLYAAAKARKEGKPLVFSNRSGLQEQRVTQPPEHTVPNHVALVNPDVASSSLTPLYADRFNTSMVVVENDSFDAFNQRLEARFNDLVGDGLYQDPAFHTDGFFITSFGAPRERREDPVEESSLVINDEADGSSFSSDRGYMNLVGSRDHLEAGFGRMSDSVEAAFSLLSAERTNDKSLVAAEYMYETWPEVVAHRGGGLWHGLSIRDALEQQGKNTTLLVERRTTILEIRKAVRDLLLSLSGTPAASAVKGKEVMQKLVDSVKAFDLQRVLETVLSNSDKIADKASDNADDIADASRGMVSADTIKTSADTFSNVVSAVTTAEKLAELFKAYLEYDIGLNTATAAEQFTEFSTYSSLDAFADAFFHSLLQPRNELSRESLNNRGKDSSMLYYVGRGNRTHWFLPHPWISNASTLERLIGDADVYNGSNAFIPDNVSGFVYDASTNSLAAGQDSVYRKAVAGGGGIAGYTAKTYLPYTAELSSRFVNHGFSYGQAVKAAINRYVKDSWTFDPADAFFVNAYWRHAARKQKTLDSFSLYGVPERYKDPVVESYDRPERQCDGSRCTYTWSFPSQLQHLSNHTVVDAQREEIPGLPTVYFHTAETTLPATAEIIDVSTDARTSEIDDSGYNTTFPRKTVSETIEKLAAGRKQVRVKHLALQYHEDGITNFEDITVEAETVEPLRTSLDTVTGENDSYRIHTSVYTERPQDARLILQLENQTTQLSETTTTHLANGTSTHTWSIAPDPGRYELTLYVTTGDTTAQYSDDITLHETGEPSVTVSVPRNVTRGDPFTAEIVASNPTYTTRTVSVSFPETQYVLPAFLQPWNVSFTVEPHTTEKRELRLQAFSPSVDSIPFRTRIDKVEETVTPETSVERGSGIVRKTVSALKNIFSSTQPERSFSVEAAGQSMRIQWQTPRGTLSVSAGQNTTIVLETPGRNIVREIRPGREATELETADGSAHRIREAGTYSTATTGTVTIPRLRRASTLLERETRKALARYGWEDGTGAAGFHR